MRFFACVFTVMVYYVFFEEMNWIMGLLTCVGAFGAFLQDFIEIVNGIREE